MGRSPCCSKVGLKRGPWSAEEDALLTAFIQLNGEGQWRSLPKRAGLLRCGKSCRLRWMNYLRPGIKRGNIDQDEEDLIVRLHRLLGNRWSLIAGRLPGRTDNEIKNHWNTHLLKKLAAAGNEIHPLPRKNLPKPAKGQEPRSVDGAATAAAAAASKKTKKKKKSQPAVVELENNDKERGVFAADGGRIGDVRDGDDVPETILYCPKPIRVSSSFSRTDSVDSLQLSGCSSSDVAENKDGSRVAEVARSPVDWPMFELGYELCGGDDFLGGYSLLPLPLPLPPSALCHDVIALDQVYDEYLSLL